MRARHLLAALSAATAVVLGSAPASAGGPTRITITGPGLAAPIVIHVDADPELFTQVSVVIYAAGLEMGRRRDPGPTGPAALGPRYILAMDYHDVPTYVYDLYPQASGGPHIYVPAKQPRPEHMPGQSGWYRSDGGMPAALQAAGIDLIAGGGGGPVISSPAAPAPAPTTPSADGLLNPWSVLGAAVVLFGLLFAARRRRSRRTSLT
jgi:hypothetical protein